MLNIHSVTTFSAEHFLRDVIICWTFILWRHFRWSIQTKTSYSTLPLRYIRSSFIFDVTSGCPNGTSFPVHRPDFRPRWRSEVNFCSPRTWSWRPGRSPSTSPSRTWVWSPSSLDHADAFYAI